MFAQLKIGSIPGDLCENARIPSFRITKDERLVEDSASWKANPDLLADGCCEEDKRWAHRIRPESK